MWIYLLLICIALIGAGVVILKIDSFLDFIDEQNKKDLEWELKKYKKQ